LSGKKRFLVMAITAAGERLWHDAFVGSGETTMKSILFSFVMSLVLFVAVSYLHRAKADGCSTSGCATEEIVTLSQANGCRGSNC